MEKGHLVLYTYSRTGEAPPPFLLEDKKGRPIEKVCFIRSDEDRDENGWALVPVREIMANKPDEIIETQLKCFSVGQFKSEFTVWFNFGSPPEVNPWELVDAMVADGACIAMPRMGKQVYATLPRTHETRKDQAIVNRLETALNEASVGEEVPVDSSVVVRRQCVDLFRLERAWINESLKTMGRFPNQAFFLAKKKAEATKFKTIADEKLRKEDAIKG